MSVRVMNYVWQQSQQKGSGLLLLLAIADAADDDGGNAWPAVSTLAKKIRMSDRTVQNLVAELVASGELRVDLGGGKHGTHRYTIVLPEEYDTPRRPGRPRKTAEKGVQRFHPAKSAGVQSATEGGEEFAGGVQSATEGGETATAPNPSLTHPVNPSLDPSGDECIPPAPTREVRPILRPRELVAAEQAESPSWRALVREADSPPVPGVEHERWTATWRNLQDWAVVAGLDDATLAVEIHARARRYPRQFTTPFTIPALGANWAALAHDPPPRPEPASARASPGDTEALIAAQPKLTRANIEAGRRFLERRGHGLRGIPGVHDDSGGRDEQAPERRAVRGVVADVRAVPAGDIRGGDRSGGG